MSPDWTNVDIGGRRRIRTLDPLIKSQLLYQLSYAPSRSRRDGPSPPRLATRSVTKPSFICEEPSHPAWSNPAGIRLLDLCFPSSPCLHRLASLLPAR